MILSLKSTLLSSLIFTSCRAFTIPSSSSHTRARASTPCKKSCTHLSATTTISSSTQTPTEIDTDKAKALAEAAGRAIHDNHAMNALFTNVQEHPIPTPCTTTSLPSDLPRGCLVKIGPNGGSKEEGWLDGDGMVHVVTLPPEGSIMYSSTYVDTKGRRLEREVGKGKKFGGTLGSAPHGLPMLGNLLKNGITFGTLDVQKDTCNTAVAVSGKRILALMEQAPPSEIKFSKTGKMTTINCFERLNGAIPPAPINGGNLGAHGRTDTTTNERVHVSYNSNSRPYLRVDTFADDWKLKSSIGVDVPSPVMVHDCALTSNYVVILDFPLTIRPERMFLSNKFPVEYEPENGARIGLTPRRFMDDQTVWFNVEPGVVLHVINAYEREDGTVVIHGFKATPDGSSSYILDYTPSFLHEWVVDPTTGETLTDRCLNGNVMVEFPTCSVSGTRASSAYGLVTTSIGGPLVEFKTPSDGVLLDAVVKFALEDDNGYKPGDVVGRFDLPNGWHSVSEPTVVRKTGGVGEYILLIATFVPPADDTANNETGSQHGAMKSQLLILDGDLISEGPVTSIDLPYHVNYGLHSEFIDWDLMEDDVISSEGSKTTATATTTLPAI